MDRWSESSICNYRDIHVAHTCTLCRLEQWKKLYRSRCTIGATTAESWRRPNIDGCWSPSLFLPPLSLSWNYLQFCIPTAVAFCIHSLKLKFHGSSFLAASSWHPRRHARHPREDAIRGCRACRATSPSSLPRDYLIGRPAVCCGEVLPVCPCVVSFSKVHEHDTHDLSRTSSRGCHEDATRDLLPWNFSLTPRIHKLSLYRPGRLMNSLWSHTDIEPMKR